MEGREEGMKEWRKEEEENKRIKKKKKVLSHLS